MNKQEKINTESETEDNLSFKKAYLGEMRHELRTPLNGILGYCEMLIEDAEDDEDTGSLEPLNKINNDGKEILHIISDILNASRIDSASGINIAEYGLKIRDAIRPYCERMISLCENLLEKASIKKKINEIADLEKIRSSTHTLLDLADDIINFSHEKISSLHDSAFSKVITTDTPVGGIPIQAEEDDDEILNGSILVVDDNEINRDLLDRQLRRHGLDVTLAENGTKALELLAKHKFDLVLLDIVMPELGGYEVIREIKSHHETQDIPVIFMTGKTTAADETKGFKLGAVDYISKPFNPMVVKARVRTHLELVKQRREIEDLLENTLPRKVIRELKQTGKSKPESFENVTIMFSDFVNFTGISAAVSPEILIGELSEIFSAFDEIIYKYDCERIKTIGDAYLAVCGIPQQNPDHARNIINCAIEIVQYLKERNSKSQYHWENRIGIHSGPAVGGIVGTRKYLYDIFGDAVNTASRIETSSEPLRIGVSETTRNFVKEDFELTSRGKIDLKGKGKTELFYVNNTSPVIAE